MCVYVTQQVCIGKIQNFVLFATHSVFNDLQSIRITSTYFTFFLNKVIELKTKASEGRNCGNYTFDSLMVIMLFVKAAAERSVFSHVIS